MKNSSGYSLVELTMCLAVMAAAMFSMMSILRAHSENLATAESFLETNEFISELATTLRTKSKCKAAIEGQSSLVVDPNSGPSLTLNLSTGTIVPGSQDTYSRYLSIESARLVNKTHLQANDYRASLEIVINRKASGYGSKSIKRFFTVYFEQSTENEIAECIAVDDGNPEGLCRDTFGTWDTEANRCLVEKNHCDERKGIWDPASKTCDLLQSSCEAANGIFTQDAQGEPACDICDRIGMGPFDPTTGACTTIAEANSPN